MTRLFHSRLTPIRIRLARAFLALLAVSFCASPAVAQYGATGASPGQANASAGSVPTGTASPEVLRLTLSDAITRALRYNLATIESSENSRITRGDRLQALSALLPQVSGALTENVEQVSLATLGLQGKIPGIPSVVGPFSYTNVDAAASQTLFSWESIQHFRAARNSDQAARLSYQDTLDAVTLTVGNAYLQIIEAASRIEAQEAQVQIAMALYSQALDEVNAGTVPRIEATRTEVQLRTEQYNLSVDRNNLQIAKLALGRAIGLPLGQQFDAADTLPYSQLNPPTVDEALAMAFRSRADLRAALDIETSAAQALSAAKAERFPVLGWSGDYGDIGETLGHSHGDFAFEAQVSVPIFTGERIKGDITQAEAQYQQRKAEAENLRGQIDYDVRTAFLNLNAAVEQVAVAKQNVDLANDNLARSKDRFSAGVTDSVEVVQAEQSLASANDQYITSLYDHNLAKLSLARALGVAHTNYQQYLGGQ
jgi:outer membrane protein TolC